MAEENQEGQEKTEQATPKREQEARDEGQLARSRELSTMAVLMVAAISFYMIGGHMVGDIESMMREFLGIQRPWAFDPQAIPLALTAMVEDFLLMVLPFLMIMLVIALLSPLALGGWSLSTKAMAFKPERLDPIKGLSRVFARRGLMELLKALAKFALITGIAGLFIWTHLDELLLVGSGSVIGSLRHATSLSLQAFLIIGFSTVLIAVVDVPFQLWDNANKLKMTKQEIKEEMKQTEGRPEVRSRIRALQQEVASRRMMEDVPKADVIVTNPDHYAVALRYEQGSMSAPRLLAKGVNDTAERIRSLGARHDIAILQTPPLARALYFSTRIGDEIPEGLYVAVAQVLAYVYRLREQAPDDTPPPAPVDLPIPDELRRDPA